MRNILTVFILLIGFTGVAQNKVQNVKHHGITDHSSWVKFKRVENLLSQHSYYNACDLLEEIIDSLPDTNFFLQNTLAESYFTARDYQNAERVFSEVVVSPNAESNFAGAFFKYAEALQMNGKYHEAKVAFYKVVRLKDKSMDMKLQKKMARGLLKSCDYAIGKLKEDSSYVSMEHLNGGVNKAYTDFSPVALSDEELVFSSLRSDTIVGYGYGSEKFFPVKLYKTTNNGELWSEPTELTDLNHTYEHSANLAYNYDSTRRVFSRCFQNPHNQVVCSLFESNIEGNEWTQPKRIHGKVNSKSHTTTQPTFGYLRKRNKRDIDTLDVLYFVSNRPGGQGGMDIWYAIENTGGDFELPINAKRLNTMRDDVAPYYHQEEQMLYFSSNFRPGFGGFDIYKAKGHTKRWLSYENLHFPVNSSYDDTYFVPSKDSSNTKDLHGFLVSNRPGGVALASPTCCDDIYSYEFYEPRYVHVLHQVYYDTVYVDSLLTIEVDTITGDSLSFYRPVRNSRTINLINAKVGVVNKKFVSGDDGNDYSLYKNEIQWVDSVDADSVFRTMLADEHSYYAVLEAKGFDPVIQSLDSLMTLGRDTVWNRQEMRRTVYLDTMVVDNDSIIVEEHQSLSLELTNKDLKKNTILLLDNMYFDTDSDIVQDRSRPSLYLLLTFMESNPKVSVEIGGHTDSDGTEEHNEDLSQRRAERVMNFLIQKGIDAARVTAVGYGENKPVAPNTSAEGRQKNRRTEVKIL